MSACADCAAPLEPHTGRGRQRLYCPGCRRKRHLANRRREREVLRADPKRLEHHRRYQREYQRRRRAGERKKEK